MDRAVDSVLRSLIGVLTGLWWANVEIPKRIVFDYSWILYVALAMCDFIWESFTTTSNSFEYDSRLYSVNVTWYAPSQCCLSSVINFFIYSGSGVAFLIGAHGFLHFQNGFFFFLVMTGTTIICNLVTAALITFRILYFDRYIQKTLGLPRNNPYVTVIILCVESSALIVVFGSIYIILAFRTTNGSLILLPLLVHVYVGIFLCSRKRKSLIEICI